MPLVKNGAILDDPYLRILASETIPEATPVLVSADRLLTDAKEFHSRRGANGVMWPNNRPVSELAPHLPALALVALHFPTFRDGRAYSQARLLRERYGFRGELRATGDVLRDQHLFLWRAGFDAFEVRKPEDAASFTQAPREFSSVYQPAADRRPTAFQRRREASAATGRTSLTAATTHE